MLRTRTLSAIVLIPIVAAVTYAGGWILAGVLFLVVVRATYEFFSLMVRAGYRPSLLAAGVVMALFLVGARFSPNLLGPVLALSTLGTLIWQLLRPPEGHPTESWALTLGAALWLGWLGSHFVLLRDLSPPFGLGAGTRWLAVAFLVTWINDTGAYIVGKAIGRHPCCPYLSPKKTWEGTIGGWLCGVAATMLLGYWLVDLAWVDGLVLGALVASVAPFGDLAKSMVKRQMKVKDFAALIPGHGGMFDRIDSLLFVVPVIYYYVMLILR